jgi:hypothetical protein
LKAFSKAGKSAMKLEDSDLIVGIKILDDDDDFLLSSEREIFKEFNQKN